MHHDDTCENWWRWETQKKNCVRPFSPVIFFILVSLIVLAIGDKVNRLLSCHRFFPPILSDPSLTLFCLLSLRSTDGET